MDDPRISNDLAEQSLIAGVMIDKSQIDEALSLVTHTDFFDNRNAAIWKAISEAHENGQPIDPVTLAPAVGNDLFPYMVELAHNAVAVKNVPDYARMVADASIRRMAFNAGRELQRYSVTEGNAGLVADKASELAAALVRGNDFDMVSVGELAEPFIKRLIEIEAGTTSPMGLTTGIKDLDAAVMGHHPDQFIVVAARPAMGKTAWAIHTAVAAASTGKGVYFCSLEMNRDQLQNRVISHLSRVDSKALRGSRELTDNEMDRVQMAVAQVKGLPIWINDTPAQSSNQIRAGAKRAATRMQNGLGLVIVDYLQLVQGSGKAGNREQEVSEISRQMKRLSKECKCPVIALSQLNRSVEQRSDKRPLPSDLRESGSLEQDADNIYMLYRHEVYHPEDQHCRGIGEIIIRKQREGELATIYCAAQMATNRWDGLTVDAIQQYQQASDKKSGKDYGSLA